MVVAKNLKTEYLSSPIGVPLQRVRFSWQADCDRENTYQIAYQIIVKTGKKITWDSGKVSCSDTAGILYQGEALQPRTKYFGR